MDPQSNDYQFGLMSARMKSLEKAIDALTLSIAALSNDLNEIKLFRAKVLGMSVASSAIVSGIVVLATLGIQAWAK